MIEEWQDKVEVKKNKKAESTKTEIKSLHSLPLLPFIMVS